MKYLLLPITALFLRSEAYSQKGVERFRVDAEKIVLVDETYKYFLNTNWHDTSFIIALDLEKKIIHFYSLIGEGSSIVGMRDRKIDPFGNKWLDFSAIGHGILNIRIVEYNSNWKKSEGWGTLFADNSTYTTAYRIKFISSD